MLQVPFIRENKDLVITRLAIRNIDATEMINDVIVRKYQMSLDYTITLTDGEVGTDYDGIKIFVLDRNHDINTEINNMLTKVDATSNGFIFSKVYNELKELRNSRYSLNTNNYNEYVYYLYGICKSNNYKNTFGFYYPLSIKMIDDNDIMLQFEGFENSFYMPKNNMNIGSSSPPTVTYNMIYYNRELDLNTYIYYVYGTSTSEKHLGKIGYYYPLSLYQINDDDHVHIFEEFPEVTFYMYNQSYNHHTLVKPSSSLKLIKYE